MDKKKSLSFNSVSNFSSKRFEINKQNKKIETVIDLTLSDDDETESNKRISSSNPNPITKNPKKKLKLSHSKTFSFDSSDDDDELSDNIYSLFPISQEYDIKKRRNIRGIQSKKKSELQEEKKTISIPNKRRKEYKLSNVQVNFIQ
ncbi:hypothetical protein H8356DRAFT_1069343 [Neocallimastix lanati (nom. inval.)]|nr:hypothetical protein H8356DRAFT_1069343 [Neocallimastix sp. JGI-2020a]